MHEEDLAATTDHFWTSLREGWGEVRSRRWVVAFLTGMSVYHAVVLPSIFVIGPVLMERELDGARSGPDLRCFGVGCLLGDLLFLRWRPRFALRVASLMLVGASLPGGLHRQRPRHLGDRRAGAARRLCVTGAFTLWETSLGEHVPERSLSRVSSYDYLHRRGDPARQPARRPGQRGLRAARDAARDDRGRGGRLGAGRRGAVGADAAARAAQRTER